MERVRAALGRVSSHPRAIDVEALDGVPSSLHLFQRRWAPATRTLVGMAAIAAAVFSVAAYARRAA
jgi:hypothetical protein